MAIQQLGALTLAVRDMATAAPCAPEPCPLSPSADADRPSTGFACGAVSHAGSGCARQKKGLSPQGLTDRLNIWTLRGYKILAAMKMLLVSTPRAASLVHPLYGFGWVVNPLSLVVVELIDIPRRSVGRHFTGRTRIGQALADVQQFQIPLWEA